MSKHNNLDLAIQLRGDDHTRYLEVLAAVKSGKCLSGANKPAVPEKAAEQPAAVRRMLSEDGHLTRPREHRFYIDYGWI